MDTSIMNLSGIGLCILAVVMLLAAYLKNQKNDYKARRAAKKGL